MSRKKPPKKSDRLHQVIKYSSLSAIVLLLFSIAVVAGYYFGYEEAKGEMASALNEERAKTQKLISELKDASAIKARSSRKERLEELLKKHQETLATPAASVTAAHEYETTPPQGPERKAIKTPSKPKLAIIIDDVSFRHDVDALKALKMPLTMSFLPPNKRHPDSAKLAAKEPVYMVHLPLEAMRYNAEESETLYVKDSQQRIMRQVRKIKKQFPRVKYVNNHTGSKFTANELAMNRLMFALRKEQMHFIDSRTTAETKVPRVMKNYGLPYIARDVFLDHVADVNEIKKQIKRAVDIAKKSGSAIAIGHPRSDTIEALRQSKATLKGVELVTIDNFI